MWIVRRLHCPHSGVLSDGPHLCVKKLPKGPISYDSPRAGLGYENHEVYKLLRRELMRSIHNQGKRFTIWKIVLIYFFEYETVS